MWSGGSSRPEKSIEIVEGDFGIVDGTRSSVTEMGRSSALDSVIMERTMSKKRLNDK